MGLERSASAFSFARIRSDGHASNSEMSTHFFGLWKGGTPSRYCGAATRREIVLVLLLVLVLRLELSRPRGVEDEDEEDEPFSRPWRLSERDDGFLNNAGQVVLTRPQENHTKGRDARDDSREANDPRDDLRSPEKLFRRNDHRDDNHHERIHYSQSELDRHWAGAAETTGYSLSAAKPKTSFVIQAGNAASKW